MKYLCSSYSVFFVLALCFVSWIRVDYTKQTETEAEDKIEIKNYTPGQFVQTLDAILAVRNGWVDIRDAKDAWGNHLLEKKVDGKFHIYSAGGDGIPDTEDDIGMVFPNKSVPITPIPYAVE